MHPFKKKQKKNSVNLLRHSAILVSEGIIEKYKVQSTGGTRLSPSEDTPEAIA